MCISKSRSLKSSRKQPENRTQWAEISVPIIINVNNHMQGTLGLPYYSSETMPPTVWGQGGLAWPLEFLSFI